jgi:hypothetical protein
MTSCVFRVALLAVLVVSTLGCRPREPLDWEVQGRNGYLLQEWIDDALEKMPRPLADEFVQALIVIRNDTHGWSTAAPDSPMNPLCMRLKGKTVREVLIEGLQLQNESRVSRIQNDLTQIARLFDSYNAETDEPARARLQRRITGLQQRVDREKIAAARIDHRIEELRRPPPPPKSKRKDL